MKIGLNIHTHRIVKFWYAPVSNWEPRQQHEIDKGMYVTFFCEIQC